MINICIVRTCRQAGSSCGSHTAPLRVAKSSLLCPAPWGGSLAGVLPSLRATALRLAVTAPIHTATESTVRRVAKLGSRLVSRAPAVTGTEMTRQASHHCHMVAFPAHCSLQALCVSVCLFVWCSCAHECAVTWAVWDEQHGTKVRDPHGIPLVFWVAEVERRECLFCCDIL